MAGVAALTAGFAVASTPTVAAAATVVIKPVEGVPFTGQVAVATCPGGLAPWNPSVQISWIPGTVPSVASAVTDRSRLIISGTHTYPDDGAVTGTVTGTYSCGQTQ